MSIFRTRSLDIQNARPKQTDFEPPPDLGSLSPNLQPNSPPQFPKNDCYPVSKVGKYLLLEQLEGGHVFRAVNTLSQEELICKVVSLDNYRESLSGHFRLDPHGHINDLVEILLGDSSAYIFLEHGHGDLHSYVRTRRRLKEDEASRLFYQIASVVAYCHENGVVLRDLKLRKFIFKNEELTELKLESLQDTFVLEEEENDLLSDKHGCPAYVSPEILTTAGKYSGKAADVWSLGVMLYTMLVGRYPFHDSEPSALFTKIRRGTFNLPDSLSSRAKCLIRSMLRRDPSERLNAQEIVEHPWFRSKFSLDSPSRVEHKMADQTVPDMCTSDDSTSLFS